MNGKYEIKLIFHLNEINENYYVKILNTKKRIELKGINYEFSDNIFDDFQTSCPTEVCILDEEDFTIKSFTFNLLKGINNYHFFSFNNTYSFECLFYKEENLNIVIKGEEIKEFDEYSNFKRFSLVNIDTNEIMINGNKIDLFQFYPTNLENGNSFQLSFYDIGKKYIVSKNIMPLKEINFIKFYKEKKVNLEEFSNKVSKLNEDPNNFLKNVFGLASIYKLTYSKIENELNLNIPKPTLKNLFDKEEYLYFFYNFSKMRLFYLFCKKEDNTLDNLLKLYQKLEKIYIKLKNDKIYDNYEKITILLTYVTLCGKFKCCKNYLETNFDYIKVDNTENNSVVKLAINFLNTCIDNLNEESPSYFKLVEINSGYGDCKENKNYNRVFSYDIIDSNNLKKHLKGTIPSVISFYTEDFSNNLAFTEITIGGICVNKSKLCENGENFKLNINYSENENEQIKNIAMKLVERLMHECFGHSKFQFHSRLCEKKTCNTPKKCFDNKVLKELVRIDVKAQKNIINVLADSDRSDSGNYYESSFGILPGKELYTFTYLKRIKNVGKLLDHPELFYKKENLEKMQKYAYFKYLYEKMLYLKENNNKEKKRKNKTNVKQNIKEVIKLGEEDDEVEDVIELFEEEEDENKNEEKEEEKKNNNLFVNFSFEKELNYLSSLFAHKQLSKNSISFPNEEIMNTTLNNQKVNNYFLNKKTLHSKSEKKDKSDPLEINDMQIGNDKDIIYDREFLLTKYLELDISEPEWKYFSNLYINTIMRD